MKKFKKITLKLNQSLTLYIMLIILIICITTLFVATIINSISQNLFEQYTIFYVLLIGLGIILIISIILSYFLSRLITRFTSSIRSALNDISNGNFEVSFNESKNKYINEIITDFNNMAKELSSVPMLRNDFVSNFSHEFKTPIASIKGFAEVLKNKKDLTDEEKEEYLQIIIEECSRLSELANNTLLISKLDTQTKLTNLEKVYLDEQIDQCLFLFDKSIKERNISVETSLKRISYTCDSSLMQQVWINIISNAIKFTKDQIIIKLTHKDNKIIITFEDNGTGINKNSLKHVFEKFYQADNSRAQEGTGLGLAIVNRIINLHNGEISISSEENKFTKVCIELNNN